MTRFGLIIGLSLSVFLILSICLTLALQMGCAATSVRDPDSVGSAAGLAGSQVAQSGRQTGGYRNTIDNSTGDDWTARILAISTIVVPIVVSYPFGRWVRRRFFASPDDRVPMVIPVGETSQGGFGPVFGFDPDAGGGPSTTRIP